MDKISNVLVFETPEQVAEAAAERFVECASSSISKHESFTVALAGGTTPQHTYELLAGDEFRNRVAWSRVHLFFGDERMVSPDSGESNYRMVNESLISRVAIPQNNVHRMIGEAAADESARSYEAELKSFFGAVDWPRFDLVLLGLGEDGHTGSLFPGKDALKEDKRWVVATRQPQTGQERITLALPVFNNARLVMFMVTGKEKAAILARVLARVSTAEELPAQKIRPANGALDWLIDQAAASAL